VHRTMIPRTFALTVLALLALAVPSVAHAQSIWNSPNRSPRYAVELEPHLVVGAFSPPGDGSGSGLGPGLRASIPILRRGFLERYNDSVAIGFGLDWVFYDGAWRTRGQCTRFEPAPGGNRVCVEVDGEIGDSTYFFIPVVMQWNFYLHERISVFAEPGIDVYIRQADELDLRGGVGLNFQVGGRFMFTDRIGAVLRIGYPTVSLGVGFLL
jgi:hypothetical protein